MDSAVRYLLASPRIPKELCLWDALHDALVSFLLTSGIRESCGKDTGQHTEEERLHSEDTERTETETKTDMGAFLVPNAQMPSEP